MADTYSVSQHMEGIVQELATRVSEELPSILHALIRDGYDPGEQPLRLLCHLTPADGTGCSHNGSRDPPENNQNQTKRLHVASIDLGRGFSPISPGDSARHSESVSAPGQDNSLSIENHPSSSSRSLRSPQKRLHSLDLASETRTNRGKRRKAAASLPSPLSDPAQATDIVQRSGKARRTHQRRQSENSALQPSSLEKFINGIWESLFSGVRMDPTEIIEQWQAIESSGQPKLLTDTESTVARTSDSGAFGRMNRLTRKVSQTMKACRSLEVIVQAHWVQCFDDRVAELTQTFPRERAKKTAISEACVDFNWSEKELRNKMAIWRGYHDIQGCAGWSALVFAGMGLYRFCKYRVSFANETFAILRHLRHRFEVAADTLHPRWRSLLGIVGAPTEPVYRGHPHDFVVNGPNDSAIPLPQTYHQWDKNFTYEHLAHSIIDTEAWGDYDPRLVSLAADGVTNKCQFCDEHQSDQPVENACMCYPNLYGSPKASMAPVQVYRTPDGKNNGLVACCGFEKGWAVGEFVGEITTGIKGLDVMIDRTERARYQIWQGQRGNHTRFVNHSCEPNSHYEKFVWMGKQRSVLVSDGIDVGEEITVDYGNTYWEDLDKRCLCGKPGCRYPRRPAQEMITAANGTGL